MFTEKEIQFMRDRSIDVNFDDPSSDDKLLIEEVLSEYLMDYGFDDKSDINEVGRFCEGIIDKVT